ncbi:peptide chain release factor 2 [bacterium]|nr:MAG: peptide chain release factor 2 [bacterium]
MIGEVAVLEEKMGGAAFWEDQETAQATIAESNSLKAWTQPMDELARLLEDAVLYAEMVELEDSSEARAELDGALTKAASALEKLETNYMLGGPDDDKGAILELNPGAGGVDSQDWAEMLLRMYTRFLEDQGWEHTMLELEPAEEAGIKHASIEVRAPYAYGQLKGESGVHRLVRISPFDAQSRRHTSFASCFVYPLVETDIDIEIDEKDLRIDTYRASGAGGQHVNKTDSAIRITHEPTGLVVQCQNQRSQHRNRDAAMKMLRARLYQRRLEEEQEKQDQLASGKMKIDFGSQIRSYVLQPYTKVKDHRTEHETGDATGVLDGKIEPFIQAYLRFAGAASDRQERSGS